jgi:hypothetical protein
VQYKRLNRNDVLRAGDEYNAIENPPDVGWLTVQKDDYMCGQVGGGRHLIYRRPVTRFMEHRDRLLCTT